MEVGNKLFIGGISLDTNEEHLREYFEAYGGVEEAVVMRDRSTGRCRGFGFVAFADSAVVERIVKEKHVIDGRVVEAKKAVPKDSHQIGNRNCIISQGSPSPVHTKKIFVGGLASTITESGFKKYFDQFGMITDVVVMHDRNTRLPRGFGFITYDSEEAVDKALFKTFHELNGKMVEVKHAVPKELSPGPSRSQSGSRGMKRVSSFLSAYSLSSQGGCGTRLESRYNPASFGQSGYLSLSYSPSNFSHGLSMDSAFGISYGADGDSGFGYGHSLNSYYSGSTNKYGSPINCDMRIAGNGTLSNTTDQSFWDDRALNYSTNSVSSNVFLGSRVSNARVDGVGYGTEEYSLGGRTFYGRNNAGTLPYSMAKDVHEEVLRNLFEGQSFYSDIARAPSPPKIEGSASFGYWVGAVADVTHNDSVGFAGRL